MTSELNPSAPSLQGPSSILLAALAAILFCLTASAHAANILTDPGFESAGGGNLYFAGQSIDGLSLIHICSDSHTSATQRSTETFSMLN